MRVSRTIGHMVEYVLVRGVHALVNVLSVERAARLAERLAGLFFALGGRRAHTAAENVLRSGIATNMTEARRIARASMQHLAVIVVESLAAKRFFSTRNWRDYVELDLHPESRRLLETPGVGIIMPSGHIGNWELGAGLVSGIKPLLGVARAMNNPFVERHLSTRMHRGGFRTVGKTTGSARPLVQALRNGEVLAVLMDQHARTHGMMVEFFGVPASCHTSHARLHLLTGAPLIFASMVRVGPMRYRMTMDAPTVCPRSGDREKDIYTILKALNERLEDVIRRYPGQYLWAHRRWRGLKAVA